MSPTFEACLRSWKFDPWLVCALVVTAGLYLRGWLVLYRRDPWRWRGRHLVVFFAALAVIYLALASPIEQFAALLLQVHMLQHLLLMMVVPPLIWLAAPFFPLLRGLPEAIRIYWAAPVLSSAALRQFARRMTNPVSALLLFIVVTWFWHLPALYDLALRSNGWHHVQHLCFLAGGLVFWHPIVRPYPSRPRWSPWLLLPLLLVADLSNTALSALLTFSERVLYPYYAEVPRIGALSALDDQSAAGVMMWVPGSVVFLVPLFAIGIQLLASPERPKPIRKREKNGQRRLTPSPLLSHFPFATGPVSVSRNLLTRRSNFDLLLMPILGRFLKWRYARICFQVPLLLLAAVMIYDGLCGPQVGAMNLAGVLPWIHWRGVIILGLLVAGNVFCMGCPFMLPRTIARRFLPASRSWPRWLRTKWLAVFLIALFLWGYEALALWDRPWLTAWIAIGYFIGALVIDGIFSGASFCKYVCPIGQFNFVQSLVSPVEVMARDLDVCRGCQTKDCIRGRDGIPGCELHLFVPRKASNMDCTTCLDCVHTCPRDNVGLIVGVPSAQLWTDRGRSGIGRFGRRMDLAALAIVLVFGAFANAAGMVAPIADAEQRFASVTGVRSPLVAATVFYLVALLALPLLAVAGTAALSRRWGRLQGGALEVATRYAYALVPLGFGMWLAHYSFHFFTTCGAIVPVTQRLAADIGFSSLGEPAWNCTCCIADTPWLLCLELLFLDLGLLLSLYTGYRLAPNLEAVGPWAVLIVLLFVAGVWIVFQPMQMRGAL